MSVMALRPPSGRPAEQHANAVRTTGGATLSPGMRRLVLTFTVLALVVPAPAALAQQGQGDPFGPLPQTPPAETPTPTPPPSPEVQQDTDRSLLYAIGGALLVLFVVIARVITRDARKTLHEGGRDEAPKQRDQGPHRHTRQAKAKARARTKSQRRARRQNR
jgi:hypothetical protein